jgi:hypothetical protein
MSSFRVAAAHCKKIGLERLNWPGSSADISEGIQLKKKSGPIIFKPKCPFEGFSSLIK